MLRTPDDAASLRRRRVAAAALHHLAGDFERATALYESVLIDTPDGLDRADVLYALAELGTRPLPARAALVEEAIEHARSDDERAARLLGLLAIVRWLLGDAEAPSGTPVKVLRAPSPSATPSCSPSRSPASVTSRDGCWT